MKILTIIPARSGSKRLPGKNIKNFCGKPLIAWTIDAAIKAKYSNRIIVSTDDKNIAEISREFGAEVPFLRPKNLAKDDTATIDVILYILNIIKNYDWILLLQPTSPLRNHDDIDNMINFCKVKNALSSVSICLSSKKHLNSFIMKSDNKLIHSRIQEKKMENRENFIYKVNGAIYFSNINWLRKNNTFISEETIGYLMTKERSIDIDTISDWNIASNLKKEYDER